MAATMKPRHPALKEMVNHAISSLKEKKGSSLYAIKKFIGSNYTVDIEKITRYIKLYLKTGVASGGLIQVKGHGANGSFKLGTGVEKVKTSVKSSRSKAKKRTDLGNVKDLKRKPANKKINKEETSIKPESVVAPLAETNGSTEKSAD